MKFIYVFGVNKSHLATLIYLFSEHSVVFVKQIYCQS